MELFKVVEQMQTLYSEVSRLKYLIGEQLIYNKIEEADKNFKILLATKKTLDKLENTEIHISPLLIEIVEEQKKLNDEIASELRKFKPQLA
jgi:hypothetical protein